MLWAMETQDLGYFLINSVYVYEGTYEQAVAWLGNAERDSYKGGYEVAIYEVELVEKTGDLKQESLKGEGTYCGNGLENKELKETPCEKYVMEYVEDNGWHGSFWHDTLEEAVKTKRNRSIIVKTKRKIEFV